MKFLLFLDICLSNTSTMAAVNFCFSYILVFFGFDNFVLAYRLIQVVYWLLWTLFKDCLIYMARIWCNSIKGLLYMSWVHTLLPLPTLPTGKTTNFLSLTQYVAILLLLCFTNNAILFAGKWSMKESASQFWLVEKVELVKQRALRVLCSILRTWEAELMLRDGAWSSKS